MRHLSIVLVVKSIGPGMRLFQLTTGLGHLDVGEPVYIHVWGVQMRRRTDAEEAGANEFGAFGNELDCKGVAAFKQGCHTKRATSSAEVNGVVTDCGEVANKPAAENEGLLVLAHHSVISKLELGMAAQKDT